MVNDIKVDELDYAISHLYNIPTTGIFGLWDLIGIDGRPTWPMTIDELEKYYRLSAPVMGEDPSVANLTKYDTAQYFVDRTYVIMDIPLSYSDPKLLTSNKNIELRLKHNVI